MAGDTTEQKLDDIVLSEIARECHRRGNVIAEVLLELCSMNPDLSKCRSRLRDGISPDYFLAATGLLATKHREGRE